MNKELYKLSYSLQKGRRHRIAVALAFVVTVFVLINLALAFVLFPVRARSVSMSPDIAKDSCIFFTPLDRNYSRGSVVLLAPRSEEKKSRRMRILDLFAGFFTARQFLPSEAAGLTGQKNQIRRVVGVPGDTIYMRDYVLYVTPAGGKHPFTEFELVDRPYDVNIVAAPAGWDGSVGVSGSFEAFELKADEYFVLGDNRNSCVDSRFWGPVGSADIAGKALAVYFPFNKIRLF